MFTIQNLFRIMPTLYVNGSISWLVLGLTLLSGLAHEYLGLTGMVFFLLFILVFVFAIASFINVFLIIFTKDRVSSSYIYHLLSNIVYIIVVLLIGMFIFNVIGRL